jgi:hypothetical protein
MPTINVWLYFYKNIQISKDLYSLFKFLAIFKVKSFYPIKFGRIIFRITNHFLEKTMDN